jgi:outer membrane protein TolC
MSRPTPSTWLKAFLAAVPFGLTAAGLLGCRPLNRPITENAISPYQRSVAEPQPRVDLENGDPSHPLGILQHPNATEAAGGEPNATREFHLTLDQAVTKALSGSPEVRLVSLDASIAEQMIIKGEADFDPSVFGRANAEGKDVPTTTYSEIGQSDVQTLESGIKQKTKTGAEWSFSYVLTHSWDDLLGRNPASRYEPVLAFQLKQPLLRDYSSRVTLAGVETADLNHRISLLAFRQKADELAATTIGYYWQLVQAREDVQIQQQLLGMAMDTLEKVEGRRSIDATDVQIQQAQVNVRTRKAQFLQAELQVKDAQDNLARFLADPDMDLVSNYRILPDTQPNQLPARLDIASLLPMALRGNPILQQARLGVKVAEINIVVAKNQRMPRLDLVASASTQSLNHSVVAAHEALWDRDYGSYAVGVTLEYPLGNRLAGAEMQRRRLEHKKAVTTLQNLADQVALQARQRTHKVQTSFDQIQIQQEAVEAATSQLQAIADSEPVRDKLTPEFLLVKLQAQESLAEAMRARAAAVADYNIALAELAQTTGSILTLHPVELPGGDSAGQ